MALLNYRTIPTVIAFAACLQAAQKPGLAVVDLEGRNIATPDAQLLSDRLRHELIVLGKYSIVERAEMDAVLKEQGFQQSGCTSQECVVEIGQLLGAKYMVGGSVGKLGNMYMITVRMVSVESARVVKAAESSVDGAIEDLVRVAIPQVVRRPMGIEEEPSAASTAVPGLPKPPVASPPGMAWVPGGEYTMGAVGRTGFFRSPPHTVWVDGFFIDKYKITQEEYQKVMGNNPSRFSKCRKCPVENLKWDQMKAYCKRLAERLPTEAEWEKACRGGTTTRRYWSEDIGAMGEYAWYGENTVDRQGLLTKQQSTRPVGLKKPNAYGLYDMLGNVYEVVADYWDKDYYERSPKRNPQGPETGNVAVWRGGGYTTPAKLLHCAARTAGTNKWDTSWAGFRCAVDVDGVEGE